jgi:ketosteroid isomerase-like protein
MSENLDLVRSIYAGWEQGDFTEAEWADPDIEFIWADGPAPGRWKGLAGMAEGTRSWISAWEDHRPVAEEYCQLDDERVLVLISLSGRGKTSGVDLGRMGARAAHLFHIRDGKVVQFVFYFDRGRALADLGLKE